MKNHSEVISNGFLVSDQSNAPFAFKHKIWLFPCFTSLLPIAPKTLFRFGEVILPWAGESKGAGVLLFSMQNMYQ